MPRPEIGPLSAKEHGLIDAWWRAANYLSVGQIYLLDNPLLTEPLTLDHIKPRLLGHWGTTPGLNFIYAHLNRIIKARDLDMIFIAGPGHGGPGIVANTWLDGTYSEIYPHVARNARGMQRLFQQFSFPGGIPSHVAPETPGSIHEGGELGYALSHAYRRGLRQSRPLRRLRGRRRRGRDRAAGDVLAFQQVPQSRHRRRGAADSASQRLQDRQPDGAGAHSARASSTACCAAMATAALRRGRRARGHASAHGGDARSRLRRDPRDPERGAREGQRQAPPGLADDRPESPKGWTGPKEVDGVQEEGSWRAHQVPFGEWRRSPTHIRILEEWMRSYRPDGAV